MNVYVRMKHLQQGSVAFVVRWKRCTLFVSLFRLYCAAGSTPAAAAAAAAAVAAAAGLVDGWLTLPSWVPGQEAHCSQPPAAPQQPPQPPAAALLLLLPAPAAAPSVVTRGAVASPVVVQGLAGAVRP